MTRTGFASLLVAIATTTIVAVTAANLSAQERQWTNLKGQIVWDGEVPKQSPIKATVDQDSNAKDSKPLEEDYIVNPKSKGLKNVFIWIDVTGAAKCARFPAADIHPSLATAAKPSEEIELRNCRFIPHVLAVRAGQKLTVKNNSVDAHNVLFESAKTSGNRGFSGTINAGGIFELPNPLEDHPSPIVLNCSIHPWMKAYVRVFGHPYFAVTDEDGKFEIKLAPVGKYSLYIHHNPNGWFNGAEGSKGKALDIQPGNMNLGEFKMKRN